MKINGAAVDGLKLENAMMAIERGNDMNKLNAQSDSCSNK